jgi:regulator of cell morphogenesis and NO signaling
MRDQKHSKTLNLTEMKLEKLINYISNNHHPNVKSSLSRFNLYMKTIIKVDTPMHPEVEKISMLIKDLTSLMDQHLIMEENLLFPYIKALSDNKKLFLFCKDHLSESPLKKIKIEHMQILTILAKIRQLSNNFLPSVNSSPSLKLCYAQLFDFEQDIHRHVFLEEKILFPKLSKLELRNSKQIKDSKIN